MYTSDAYIHVYIYRPGTKKLAENNTFVCNRSFHAHRLPYNNNLYFTY